MIIMEKKQLSMKWYNAYKTIMLVMSILSTVHMLIMILATLITGMIMGSYSAEEIMPAVKDVMTANVMILSFSVAMTILFWLIYDCLKGKRQMLMQLIYAQTVMVPIIAFYVFREINRYVSAVLSVLYSDITSYYELQQYVMLNDAVHMIIIVIGSFAAVVLFGLLIPNCMYFRKRRHIFTEPDDDDYEEYEEEYDGQPAEEDKNDNDDEADKSQEDQTGVRNENLYDMLTEEYRRIYGDEPEDGEDNGSTSEKPDSGQADDENVSGGE